MSRMRSKTSVWTNAEDEVVKAGISKYGMNNWERVASLIDAHSAQECKDRWYQFLDPHINKGEWSRQEEEKLVELHELFPEQWALISSQIDRRTAWQCEQHYEALLQRVQSSGNGDVRQALRPLEQFAEPEIRPARPDAEAADDAEKDMLEAAVARLANKHGKKGLRNARKDQLNEATAIAQLEREREMKLSGHTSTKVQKRIQQALEADLATRQLKGGEEVDEEEEAEDEADTEDVMPEFESAEVNFQFKTKPKKDQLVVGEKRQRKGKLPDDEAPGKKAARTEAVTIDFGGGDADDDTVPFSTPTGSSAVGIDLGSLLDFGAVSSGGASSAIHRDDVLAALAAVPEPKTNVAVEEIARAAKKEQSSAISTIQPSRQQQAPPQRKVVSEAQKQRESPAPLPPFVFSADDPVDAETLEEAAAMIRDMKERRWIHHQHEHLACEPGEADAALLAEARQLVLSAMHQDEQSSSSAASLNPPDLLEYMSATVAIEQLNEMTAAFREREKKQEQKVLELGKSVAAEREIVERLERQLFFYEHVVKPAEDAEGRRRVKLAQDELSALERLEDGLQAKYQAALRSRRAAAAAAGGGLPSRLA